MTYQHYTPEFKAKIVLQVLQGEKEIGEVAKTEKIYIEEYTTERELRACIAAFINQYNNVRPHESLDNVTPASEYASSFELHLCA